MKIIKSILLLFVLSIGLTSFNACKKADNDNLEENNAFAQKAADEANLESYSGQMMDDVNTTMEDYPFAGKGLARRNICGATVDTSQKSQGIIYLNFDGSTDCRGRTREGQIKIERIGNSKWEDIGAKRKITLINLKITQISNNKSVTLNGTKEITNVMGGKINDIAVGQEIIHVIRGTLNMTFDNNTTREWNVARRKTFTKDSAMVVQVENKGDTTLETNSNVVFWGKNRMGENFLTSTPTPIVANNSCGFDEPIAGVITHHKMNRNFKITFGVDMDGNSISSGCAYGYKVEFKNRKGEDVRMVEKYK